MLVISAWLLDDTDSQLLDHSIQEIPASPIGKLMSNYVQCAVAIGLRDFEVVFDKPAEKGFDVMALFCIEASVHRDARIFRTLPVGKNRNRCRLNGENVSRVAGFAIAATDSSVFEVESGRSSRICDTRMTGSAALYLGGESQDAQ